MYLVNVHIHILMHIYMAEREICNVRIIAASNKTTIHDDVNWAQRKRFTNLQDLRKVFALLPCLAFPSILSATLLASMRQYSFWLVQTGFSVKSSTQHCFSIDWIWVCALCTAVNLTKPKMNGNKMKKQWLLQSKENMATFLIVRSLYYCIRYSKIVFTHIWDKGSGREWAKGMDREHNGKKAKSTQCILYVIWPARLIRLYELVDERQSNNELIQMNWAHTHTHTHIALLENGSTSSM